MTTFQFIVAIAPLPLGLAAVALVATAFLFPVNRRPRRLPEIRGARPLPR